MTLSDAIVKLRLELGLTQRELAEKAGIQERSVRRYEAGRSDPDPAPLASFASLAAQAGLHELANLFAEALVDKLGLHKLDVFVGRSGRATREFIDEKHGLVYEQPVGPLYSMLLVSKHGDDAPLISALTDALAVLFYSQDQQARARVLEALKTLARAVRPQRRQT